MRALRTALEVLESLTWRKAFLPGQSRLLALLRHGEVRE